jgi:hypothetical protein
MRLQVVLHVVVEPGEMLLARETAGALLHAAGVTTDWHECSVLVSRCEAEAGLDVLTVRLMPTKVTGSRACGHLAHEHGQAQAALIHVLRQREMVRKLQHSAAGRSHPQLFSLRAGHVMGLSIAHEVGHALELAHADRGVMKDPIGVDELVALRDARLGFTPTQAASMRRALLEQPLMSAR